MPIAFDAIGRIEGDALPLTAQALALGERGHKRQRVAKNQAIRPVLVVRVELGLIRAFRNAIEVREQIAHGARRHLPAFPGAAQKVINPRLRANLSLDSERRCVHDKIAPALSILASPDELPVEVGMARIAQRLRALLRLLWYRLV
ncbi:MAG: hypothetical protein ACYCXX_14875 [Acidiferrobacter thiooxydans]